MQTIVETLDHLAGNLDRRETLERLSGIVQSAMHAIIMVDEDMNIVLFNPAAETIFGYPCADITGAKLDRLIPERFRHAHGQSMKAFGASKTTIRRMNQREGIAGLRANGEEFPAEASISHQTLNGKKFYTVILADVTVNVEAEKYLRIFAEVFETCQEGMMITDAANRIISVNPAFTTITGYTRGEVIGKSPAVLSSGVQDEEFYRTMWASVNESGRWQGEIWDRRRSGELYCEWLSVSTIKNQRGEIAYHTAIFSDITERKRAEVERAHLAAIVESSQDAIVSSKPDGTILTWNAGAERMFGYTAAELLGRNIIMLVPDDRREEARQRRASYLSGHRFEPYESERIARDGRRLAVSVNASAISDEAGNITGAATIYRDITELKRARQELERKAALNQLMEALARAANEANTPAEAMQRCLQHICEYGRWPLGCVGTFTGRKAGGIPRTTHWHAADPARFAEFIHVSEHTDHTATRGHFVGRVLRERSPVWLADLSELGAPGRIGHAAQRGLRSAFAFPVIVGGGIAAFLEFFAEEAREPDQLFLDAIGAVGAQLARLIERGRAEEMNARLAAIVENSNDAIFSRTLDGTILTWNAGAERMLGYTDAEAIGRPIAFTLPPGRPPNLARNNEKVLRGEVAARESDRVTKDGRVIDVLTSHSPIRDGAGNIVGASIIMQDISALKRAQALVRESEQRFRAIFDYAGVGITMRPAHDRNHPWTQVNDHFCKLLGYTHEELLRLSTADITPPDEQESAVKDNERLLRGEIASYVREKRVVRKDERSIWVDLAVAALPDSEGRPRNIISVYQDITERKRAEQEIFRLNAELEQRVAERTQQLEAINKELEAFSYSVSHDLRAPLRGIDGFSQMLLKKYASHLDDTAADYLQRIRRATLRMGELIDDLLQLSKISGSRIRIEAVDLSQLARSVLETLQESEPARKVVTEVQDGIEMSGDPRLLKIALENLLGNAWKFTTKKVDARIRLGIKEQDGEQVAFVKDNGAGFNMKYAHKLFGAFQRLHGVSEFEGTGIGLATVQRIVNLHGGRIWANATIGKGATFYLAIPRAAGNGMTTTQQGETA